jgi:protein-disulfide isomerase
VAVTDLYRTSVVQPDAASEAGIARGSKLPITPLDPVLGDHDAELSVVMFASFQCPFSSRGAKTVEKLQKKYPNDLNIVFKHHPLQFQKQSRGAARAAIAAHQQGKFWEMHDWLFENQRQFKSHADDMKEWTSGHARTMGLDVAKFVADYDAPATLKKIDDDIALADEVNAKGTPHFFVNGERMPGAKQLAAFEDVVREKLEQARALRSDGVDSGSIYAKMVDENLDLKDDKPVEKAAPKKPAQKVEYVPVKNGDPTFGNGKDALVTIVEFASFQCGFSARAVATVDRIKKEYGDQVRVVFKQLPLPMHAQSKPAAIASLAAHRQGKFWQMHDKLFENQKQMRNHGDDFKEWTAGFAKELGMNVDNYEKDFDDPALAAKAESDLKLSQNIGARGTPNFWINGVNVRGAQPFSVFKEEIDAQIEKAKVVKAEKQLFGEALYAILAAQNKSDAPAPEPKQARPNQRLKTVDVEKLTAGDAFTQGPDSAAITIVEFSDFQCRFCKKGGANMREAAAKFGDKVQVVFKHYPLPFHKQAPAAAKAAMAAGEQGKFWEMHEALFKAQDRFKEEGIFEELAEEIGLDMKRFNKDRQNPQYQRTIDQDMKQGQAAGVRGTPAFFINGTRVEGAQPVSKFKALIEEELK